MHEAENGLTDYTDHGDMRDFTLNLISALVKILVRLLGLLARWLACDGRDREEAERGGLV